LADNLSAWLNASGLPSSHEKDEDDAAAEGHEPF